MDQTSGNTLPDFGRTIAFRCPAALATVTRRAAAREMTTPSAYVRRALVRQLREDGIEPAQEVAA
ncbi:MAG: hypothetical protein AB7O60_07390 [Variibacter sp.]